MSSNICLTQLAHLISSPRFVWCCMSMCTRALGQYVHTRIVTFTHDVYGSFMCCVSWFVYYWLFELLCEWNTLGYTSLIWVCRYSPNSVVLELMVINKVDTHIMLHMQVCKTWSRCRGTYIRFKKAMREERWT